MVLFVSFLHKSFLLKLIFLDSHTGILLHESINYIALEYDEFQLWISSEATQAWKDWWRSAAIATSSQGPSRIKFSNINITYWKNLLLGIHKEWLKIKTKGPKRIRSASLEATPEVCFSFFYYIINQANLKYYYR